MPNKRVSTRARLLNMRDEEPTMSAVIQPETKVLSVRLPSEEAKHVDYSAEVSGLSRNDYIRMRLKTQSGVIDTEALLQLIDVLRQVEKALDSYLSQLESLLLAVDDLEQKEETVAFIIEEIANAKALMDLVFRVQKQAARVIRTIRNKVNDPING